MNSLISDILISPLFHSSSIFLFFKIGLEVAARMSPIGFGNTFGIASEFTNEIYDISNDANAAAVKEGGDTWTMVLGIVVTLLPKVCNE